jgi:hypothetical protein
LILQLKFIEMKKSIIYLAIFVIACSSCHKSESVKPRVFIFTDINIDSGDPDDRQSLVHLLWYADELQIEGIVPDRWYARGFEACTLAVEAYAKDYQLLNFDKLGYPAPHSVYDLIAVDMEDAMEKFRKAASVETSPLYVLVWGNMVNFGEALRRFPGLAANVRAITIGTHLMMEEHIPYIPENWEKMELPCQQYNWNGWGRNEIFDDPRFKDMWWLEINWTYEGMFSGDEPAEIYQELSQYGALGQHMIDVTANEPWARYFRVGDTPSVLYVIDPDNDLDDPTLGSWAGRFVKPFPDERPNYYTDHNGPVEWDYADPCNTWENHVEMNHHAKSTLEKVRPAMYDALLKKLDQVYGK